MYAMKIYVLELFVNGFLETKMNQKSDFLFNPLSQESYLILTRTSVVQEYPLNSYSQNSISVQQKRLLHSYQYILIIDKNLLSQQIIYSLYSLKNQCMSDLQIMFFQRNKFGLNCRHQYYKKSSSKQQQDQISSILLVFQGFDSDFRLTFVNRLFISARSPKQHQSRDKKECINFQSFRLFIQ